MPHKTNINRPQNAVSNERVIGIDIVKIIAMFLVTLLHVTGVGGAVDSAENTPTILALCTLNGISFCCINLFALATGFLYYNRKNRYSRLIQLWIQVVFWAILANIIPAVYCKDFSILTETPLVRLFVISFLTYWYVDAYFILFLFIPLLNAAIEKLNEKGFIAFSALTMVLFGIVPFIFNNDIAVLSKGYSFAWLVYLYLLGAGIKKFNYISRIKTSVVLFLAVFMTLIQTGVTYICKTKKPTFMDVDYSGTYEKYHFIVLIILSISLFLLISKIKISSEKAKKLILMLSSASFSVYLIQCNHSVMSNLIEKKFDFIGAYSPLVAVACAVGISLAFYLGLTILGIIQNELFKVCKVNSFCEFIEKIFKKIFNAFYYKVFSKCVKN